MANPREGNEVVLKRAIRYLVQNRILELKYPWPRRPRIATIFTDSDWAGCTRTRKSTSGGLIKHGCHLIHHWSSTQTTVARSAAGAELNAINKGMAEGILIRNVATVIMICWD